VLLRSDPRHPRADRHLYDSQVLRGVQGADRQESRHRPGPRQEGHRHRSREAAVPQEEAAVNGRSPSATISASNHL